MSIRALSIASFLAVLAPLSQADTITFHSTAGPFSIGATGTLGVPQFDPALGVLRIARVTILGSVSGTWSVENTSANPVGAFGYASGQYVGAIVPNSLGAPGPSPAFLEDTAVPLAPFDGVLDFAGPSAATRTFTNAYGDGNPGPTYDFYMDAALQPFVGTGTRTFTFGAIIGTGPGVPPWIQSTHTISVDLAITVRYEYEPFPTKMCYAASWSGCPCGNSGGWGRGCGNSVNAQGGTLDGSGATSLSADTFVLAGSGMTNSNALYFQGTTFNYVQSLYGDGLRCVTGSVVRLGTKTNVAGASQYPIGADLPVSVRGGVAAPGTRYYQVIYRDGGSFCTPSQFNGTSAVAVLWSP